MKKILSVAVTVAALSSSALAVDAQALYKPCAGCHGAQGQMVALGKSKVIKDMSKEDFVAAMQGYKDGSYGGPMKGIMAPQVAKLSSEDIEALADLIVK